MIMINVYRIRTPIGTVFVLVQYTNCVCVLGIMEWAVAFRQCRTVATYKH